MKLEDAGKDILTLSTEKIEAETGSFNGGRKEKAVYKYVADVLKNFCRKDERFAKVVYSTKRTLSDCVEEIMKDCGDHISDFDVYQKATQFYFPNSKLSCVMTIEINGEEPNEEYLNKEAPKPKEKSPVKKPIKKTSEKSKAMKPNKKVEKNASDVIQLTLF